MPNDMSHPPRRPRPPVEHLAVRATRYCARADALAREPELTVADAATALRHLAGLQADLARERLTQGRAAQAALARAERLFAPHEAALTQARATLSEALLHARPDQDTCFGRIPHGAPQDGARARTGAKGDPAAQAISACRALLDLEALRPFLSEDALRHAIAQHARATGRHDLQGVAYAALPEGAHLPCAIA